MTPVLLVAFTLLIYAAVANGAIHNKEDKENNILTAGLFGEAYSLTSHYYMFYRAYAFQQAIVVFCTPWLRWMAFRAVPI